MYRVWISGTFDEIKRYDIEILKFASKYGVVKVGVFGEPKDTLKDRMYIIENIKCVAGVVSYISDRDLELQIQSWNPDYIVVDNSYKDKVVIGSNLVNKVIFFDKK